MPMRTCGNCGGRGSTSPNSTATTSEVATWCRECYGSGLTRIPDEDDERIEVSLLWPESIRWKSCA